MIIFSFIHFNELILVEIELQMKRGNVDHMI